MFLVLRAVKRRGGHKVVIPRAKGRLTTEVAMVSWLGGGKLWRCGYRVKTHEAGGEVSGRKKFGGKVVVALAN